MIKFKSDEHRAYYLAMLEEHRSYYMRLLQEEPSRTDVYYRALFYTIGISKATREHSLRIFDSKRHIIRIECLNDSWQTSGTRKICLFAFNLFNGFVDREDYRASSPEDLFACSFAPYFVEALRIRFPEYLGDE